MIKIIIYTIFGPLKIAWRDYLLSELSRSANQRPAFDPNSISNILQGGGYKPYNSKKLA